MAEAGASSGDFGNRRILTLSNISSKSHDPNEGATVQTVYMVIGHMVKSAIWSVLLRFQLGSYIIKVFGYVHVPSVGVKERLSCVISRSKWRGKARNLALP